MLTSSFSTVTKPEIHQTHARYEHRRRNHLSNNVNNQETATQRTQIIATVRHFPTVNGCVSSSKLFSIGDISTTDSLSSCAFRQDPEIDETIDRSFPISFQRETIPTIVNRETRTSSPEDETETCKVKRDRKISQISKDLPNLREIVTSGSSRIFKSRRESNSYVSNLNASDEEGRNSSSFDALLLDYLLSFLKKRRESAAIEINSSKIDEELATTISDGVIFERMPMTELHRKLSGRGGDLEMPNTEEDLYVHQQQRLEVHLSNEEICSNVKLNCNKNICNNNNIKKFDEMEANKVAVTMVPSNTSDMFDTRILKEYIIEISRSDSKIVSDDANQEDEGRRKRTIDTRSNQITVTRDKALMDLEKQRVEREEMPTEEFFVTRSRDTETIAVSMAEETEEHTTTKKKEEEEKETIKKSEQQQQRQFNASPKIYRMISTQSEEKTMDENEASYFFDASSSSSFFIGKIFPAEIKEEEEEEEEGKEEKTEKKRKTGKEKNKQKTIQEPSDAFVKEKSETSDVTTNIDSNEENSSSASPSVCCPPLRQYSSPSEAVDATTQNLLVDVTGGVPARPIYPYCPYSPYGSPQGSPRNRRRPLRESRRVSIDNRQGALQLNQYKLLENIGQGSYGIVKLVYNEEDKTHYAMKILSKRKLMKKAGIFGRMAPGRKGSADPLAKVYREIALLKKLDHPNVVKLVEVLDDPDEDNLYLVFELVERGEILQIPTDKPLDEETARRNFRDVVMGVEYLHYQRIVHRDIKPSNLLVDSEGRIKIADLGVSAELRASGDLLSGPAGTPAFAAPETTTPGAHYSGTLCDIWSMGITLYCLVTGKLPWDGAGSIIAMQAAVRSEPLQFPETPTLSPELRDLITRMLLKDPKKRINLTAIKQHVWLTQHGKDLLPSESDNCRLPITITDEEIERVVTKIPKLDTLILIKTMLKQHSFQNPFLSRKIEERASGNDIGLETSTLRSTLKMTTDSLCQYRNYYGATKRNIKSERFQKAGRSNSAPDSFEWQFNTRQMSTENPLPPVTEATTQETEIEKR